MSKRWWPLALIMASSLARADFSIPGFELAHTAPQHAGLDTPDLRDPATVWGQLFDSAKREIALEQFYVAGQPGSLMDGVIEKLDAAGRRGVKIRFLMEKKGMFASDPATIERLKRIPNLEYRQLDYNQLTGNGIIHAKFIVVDRQSAYVGSQNFDWRSLQHIHETGLKVDDAAMAGRMQAIFEQDWAAQATLAAGGKVKPLRTAEQAADLSQPAALLASPNAYNPDGVGDSEQALPRLMAEAKDEVRIQLLDYAPLSFGKPRSYYPVFDNAIRGALARGVRVKLMVSDWNLEKPGVDYLKSLAVLPGMEVRVVTIPRDGACIPFARVIHSKTMEIDGRIAWVGTSNWSGGYMDKSRNLEVALRSESMARRIAALHEQTWSSPYAAPLDVSRLYQAPDKACRQAG
ncbi:phospholipase D-like domain-containing protein [Chromobacterium piscinae]|uniref:phospholipase D-like domain-containing protein n=1 Tax=Chromobacterium piscinae TaxID=686831 RepID=UPI001E5F1305|nr:phospholipase D-like domain-containing protein [Chromobacterium piscinae]MCD4505704.1 phospholipase D-like domain-containing protein [Chromobacterium piscinae]MCD5328067.1 phospholipase D-like domain-containing protein [Chromobacterium piscinae]